MRCIKASECTGPVINYQTVKSGQKSQLSGEEAMPHSHPECIFIHSHNMCKSTDSAYVCESFGTPLSIPHITECHNSHQLSQSS